MASEVDWFTRQPFKTLGRISLWTRDWWILAVVVMSASIALATLPRLAVDASGKVLPWAVVVLTVLGAASAIAVILDKMADKYSDYLDDVDLLAEQAAGCKAIVPIISLLAESTAGAMLTGARRDQHMTSLRTAAVAAGIQAPLADNVRATYYTLVTKENGYRELRDPKSQGRPDEANTEYFEEQDPEHPIWSTLDGRDTDCRIYSAPDRSCQVDWDSKAYRTFVSVPVKVGKVPYGLISINAPCADDLTELDRLATIALARTMATGLAYTRGAQRLKEDLCKLESRTEEG